MKKIAIERKSNLLPADFVRDHLQGTGMPVVVTDAIDNWPARSKWTFDFFKQTYGTDFVTATLGLYGEAGKLTSLAAYIDHLDDPWGLPGFWVNSADGKPLATAPAAPTSPPYLMDWLAFERHPELYEDIKPAPYFIDDWTLAFDQSVRDSFQFACDHNYWALYIGSEGSLSELHQDFWHTHSCLSQVQGRKRAILFSPEDSPYLYEGKFDPECPDLERFDLLERATAYECVLEAGDTLFTPPNWWHHVRGLEKSVTVSHNFFNAVNFSTHMTRLMRKLPRMIAGVEQVPSLRDSLGIQWRSKGFEESR